jgi:hypothetical protein
VSDDKRDQVKILDFFSDLISLLSSHEVTLSEITKNSVSNAIEEKVFLWAFYMNGGPISFDTFDGRMALMKLVNGNV